MVGTHARPELGNGPKPRGGMVSGQEERKNASRKQSGGSGGK